MQKLSAYMENIRKYFSLYIILNIQIRLSSTKNKRRTAVESHPSRSVLKLFQAYFLSVFIPIDV